VKLLATRAAALAVIVVVTATGCARPETPAASPVAPTIVDVVPTTTAAPAPPAAAATAVAAVAPSSVIGPSGGSIRPSMQRSLNAAVVPFAKYMNEMHKRIHGYFADDTLGKLDALPANDPLNDVKLTTRVEIVIDGKSGNLVKVSVVKTSGNARFDAFGVDAVQRAAPFGAADGALWSTDGNVYFHWEFKRDEVFACSTMNARPFLLDLGAAPP